MLNILRTISQEVNSAATLSQVLEIVVERVRQAMLADKCAVYLVDPAQRVIRLEAGDAEQNEKLRQAAYPLGQGLVGFVATGSEPLNLADSHRHDHFDPAVNRQDDVYHGFLAAPIIHQKKTLGVLVVRQKVIRQFQDDEVAFLVTIAAQLAGRVAHAQQVEGEEPEQARSTLTGARVVKGVASAPGISQGTAVALGAVANLDDVPERSVDDVVGEIQWFRAAVARVSNDIHDLRNHMAKTLNEKDQTLFDAYLLMLNSSSLVDRVEEKIREGSWAAGAVKKTIDEYLASFELVEDNYIRERMDDIKDIGARILQYLFRNIDPDKHFPEDTVILASDASVTMLADIPGHKLKGIICEQGSSSSHIAILAQALNVPAVMGVGAGAVTRLDGQHVIVDGNLGRVYMSPSTAVRQEYYRLEQQQKMRASELNSIVDMPADTLDNVHIPLYVNTGLLADISPALKSGADGVGLYRTEFPFMMRDRFPTEEEQFKIYRRTLQAFAPRPVTLRTLDIGGDKHLSYFPIHEDNPFLGWRGVRVTLDHPEIFLPQLRAMMRASEGHDNLRLMLPMVTSVQEVKESLALVDQAYHALLEDGHDIKRPDIGAMIEVPAAIYQVAELAEEIDFVSVGSNDLTQYLLAVDRNNARVSALYDRLHPAVLRSLKHIVDEAHRCKIEVTVCGELSADPVAVVLLLGLGVDGLSMNSASLPTIKWLIRNMSYHDARELALKALTLNDSVQIRENVQSLLDSYQLSDILQTL